jgi:hypothetical protein
MTAYLAEVLRAEGCKVSETGGWQSRGRAGAYAPFGVLNHHTATPSASYTNPNPTLNMCINGRSDLPGPLCQVMIGYDGVCHIIAAGRANHAGQARNSPPIPAGDGNAMMVGYEWDYSGTKPPSPEQYQAAVLANAAVLRRMGRNSSYAKGHRETSVEGKPDPFGVDLDKLRADIAARLAGGSGPAAPPQLHFASGQEDARMAITTGPNGSRVDLLFVGAAGDIQHWWAANPSELNTKPSKESLGGQARKGGGVSGGWTADGKYYVVTVEGNDNRPYERIWDGKAWTGWVPLGPPNCLRT